MKSSKRIVVVLLATALIGVILLLLGCGKHNNPTEPVSKTITQNTDSNQDSDNQGKTVEGAQGTIILTPAVVTTITITSIAVNNAMMMNWPILFNDGDVVTIYGLVNGCTDQSAVSVLDEISLICAEAPVDRSGGAFHYSLTIRGNGVYSIHFCYNGAHAIAPFTVAAQPSTNAELQTLISLINAEISGSGVIVNDIQVLTNDGQPITSLTLGHPWGLQIHGIEDVTSETAPYILFSEALANDQLQYGGTIMYDRQLFSFPAAVVEKANQIVLDDIKTEMKKNPAVNLMNELMSNPVHAILYGATGIVCYTPTLQTKVACGILVSMSRADLIQAGITTALQNVGELTQDQRNLIASTANLGVGLWSFFKSGAGISIFDGRLADRSKALMLGKYIDGTVSGLSAIDKNTLVTFNSTDGSFSIHLVNSDGEVVVLPWYDQVKSIRISPSSYSMHVGGTKRFLAEALNAQGLVLNVHPLYRIDGSIGTIASDGLFTATNAGNGSVVGWLPPFFNVSPVMASVTVAAPANTSPIACFTYSPQVVTTYTSVTLDARCSSDLETALSALLVRWQIDGAWTSWTTMKTRTKQWASAGQKTVILEVKDAGGLISQMTKIILVTAAPAPIAYITVCPGTGTTGSLVSTTVTAENAQQIRISWGGQSTHEYYTFTGQPIQVTHTYTSAGSYYINVWAYGGGVWSSGVTCLVKISNPVVNTPPTPCFAVTPQSGTGTTATVFAFDAQCSSDKETPISALQVRWLINGTWTPYTTLKSVTNQWSTPGTYTVVLEVKDAGGLTAQASKTVTVGAVTVTLVILNTGIPNGNLLSNYSVTFICSGGTEGWSVAWSVSSIPSGLSFRNNADRTATLSGVPGVQGSFPITVTVKDMGNSANTATKNFTLIVNPPLNNPPIVSVASTATGQVGATTAISYTATDQETPSANLCVAVDWLDGSSIGYFWAGVPATHIYSSIGTYGARFTAWDGTNWSATSTCYITITNSCSNMPTLLGPINGQTVSLSAGFSFFWTKVCDGFGEYNLYVMTAPNSSGTTVFADRMSPTWTSLRYWGSGLQPNTTYYWCLQMGNYTGAPLTSFASFRTAP